MLAGAARRPRAAQDGAGNVVGEVHQRWHLWKRNYDLYISEQQPA